MIKVEYFKQFLSTTTSAEFQRFENSLIFSI